MSVATFKVGKNEYVIITRREYEQLTREGQDRKDAAVARKADEAFLAGKLKTIPLDVARRKWGV